MSKRAKYTCRLCGLPKRGHTCTAKVEVSNDSDEDSTHESDSCFLAYKKLVSCVSQQYKSRSSVTSSKKKFYVVFEYESSPKQWTPVDSDTTTTLMTLVARKDMTWTPIPGKQVSYSVGINSYEANVKQDGSIEQCNKTHGTVRKIRMSGSKQMLQHTPKDPLYGDCFVTIPDNIVSDIETLLYKANDDDRRINGCSFLSSFADMFSSLSDNLRIKYDKQVSELWIKPLVFKLWLRVLKRDSGPFFCKIVQHGTDNYDALFRDAAGFDKSFSSAKSIKGCAQYLSFSNHVPSEYNFGKPEV